MPTLWRTWKIAERLRRNEATELEAFAAFLLLFGVFGIAGLLGDTPNSSTSWLELLASILGMIYSYRSNRDRTNFLKRFMCLAVPLVFKTLVLSVIGLFLCLVFADLLGRAAEFDRLVDTNNIYFLYAIALIYALFFLRMMSWLEYISRDNSARAYDANQAE